DSPETRERDLPSSSARGRTGNATFPALISPGEEGRRRSPHLASSEEEGTSSSLLSRALKRRERGVPCSPALRERMLVTRVSCRRRGKDVRRHDGLRGGRRTFRLLAGRFWRGGALLVRGARTPQAAEGLDPELDELLAVRSEVLFQHGLERGRHDAAFGE